MDTDEVPTPTIPIHTESTVNMKRKRNITKSVTGSRNDYGFSIKSISMAVTHDNDTVSKGISFVYIQRLSLEWKCWLNQA